MKSLRFDGLTIYENGEIRGSKGSVLKPWNNGYGYLYVEGATKKHRVHRLVARLLTTYQDHLDVNHKDGDKANNHVSNLEMLTRAENLKHSWKLGLHKSTPARSKKISEKVSKLKKSADSIRAAYERGESSRALGRKYGVDKSTILNIVGKKFY